MTWDKGIEAAAKAVWPIVLAQHEMIDPAFDIAEAAIRAFLDAQPTVQWCEVHRANYDGSVAEQVGPPGCEVVVDRQVFLGAAPPPARSSLVRKEPFQAAEPTRSRTERAIRRHVREAHPEYWGHGRRRVYEEEPHE